MSSLRVCTLLPLFALAALLSACDSGVGTSSNPNLNSGNTGYNGPPARTADIRSFELNFWTFLKEDNRCGQCHDNGQAPEFVDTSDVNRAYSEAIAYANLQDPASSIFVTKVGGGHNCWLTSTVACATNIEQMITNWATDSNVTSARLIQLTPPPIKDPGDAKSFPPTATTPGTNGSTFASTVHPILIGAPPIVGNNCQGCHEETANPLPIAPFFANDDVNSAYEAAKSKMDIDTPVNSRFVVRLGSEFHNCWTSDCGTYPPVGTTSDAARMLAAIQTFADGIAPTPVDPSLLTSKALNLTDGIVAAGGNRHESNLVALWEFKTGSGSTAFDTSGIDPAVDLNLLNSVTWLGGYGLEFSGGQAQASTGDSSKLHTFIESTGEYALEAWVIPANVTQEDANIVSYSGGATARNFTLGQRMYNYDHYNRSSLSDTNGEPFFTSDDNNDNEVLQASLQHIVVNYDPINGRNIYVNGQLVPGLTDPTPPPLTINNTWDNTFAFVLGNEVSGNRPWSGQVRLVAIHNRTLNAAQVQQNFDVGVGEKYFLLFYVGHRIGIPDSYVLFEVSQFDSYSYLFNRPTFINLDPNWTPVAVNMKGMRIGINGKEAFAGQAFANLDFTVDGTYDPQFGQPMSTIGTIISLEKGASSDEFFLTFEEIGGSVNAFNDPQPPVPNPPADPTSAVESDIGVRTFEEINSTIAAITGIPTTNPEVNQVYDDYVQQLPTVEAIDAFLPSHQMAVAQLALTSCSELVDNNPGFFAGFNFNQTSRTAFGPLSPGLPSAGQQANRDLIIDVLLTAATNVDQATPTNNLTTQPDEAEMAGLFGAGAAQNLDTGLNVVAYDSLFTKMINTCTPIPPAITCTPEDTIPRTAQIVKAVCAAAVGGAVMLVQ